MNLEKIREMFEKHTVPNFSLDDDGVCLDSRGLYRNRILEDHWQTFQEAVELAAIECMKLCHPKTYHGPDHESGMQHCEILIRKHFGVE
jgi:hypothetical protein